jgi:hypothetical protein
MKIIQYTQIYKKVNNLFNFQKNLEEHSHQAKMQMLYIKKDKELLQVQENNKNKLSPMLSKYF